MLFRFGGESLIEAADVCEAAQMISDFFARVARANEPMIETPWVDGAISLEPDPLAKEGDTDGDLRARRDELRTRLEAKRT